MNGEFKLELKDYDPEVVIKLFEAQYGRDLQAAYGKSAFAKNKALNISKFYAGYYTNDSLFLLYTREANTLKIYVETVLTSDLCSGC